MPWLNGIRKKRSTSKSCHEMEDADAPTFNLAEIAIHIGTALRRLRSNIHISQDAVHSRSYDVDIEFVKDFFVNNQWFTRLWVVQEIALPTHAVILFGPVALSLNDLDNSLNGFPSLHMRNNCCWRSGPLVSCLRAFCARFASLKIARHRAQKPDIATRLLWARFSLYGYLVTDHRDHVYGVSALSCKQSSDTGQIQPNYDIGPEALFMQLCEDHFKSNGSLYPLYQSSTKFLHPNTPSWAID